MATNVLEAKITGDVSGLKKALSEAERLQQDYGKAINKTQKDIADNIVISRQYQKAIDQLNKELAEGSISSKDYSKQLERIKSDEKKTQIETSNLRKELSRLKREQKDLATVNGTATKSIGGLKKGTANATPTVIEFSRVIQDAPYGIQGVANNIQQLTGNFANLQKQAGGTVPALKAFAGSFLGPAGIVFAVSAVTSLLVTYGDELFNSKSDTEKLAEATQKAAEEMEAFIDSLNDVDRAIVEGQKSAAKEITTLKSLRTQIENTANSTELRLDGIKRLREEFGAYFKNISDEALLNGTAAASYDTLTNSILKRAKATAASNILVKNAEKEIEINEKLKKNNEDIIAQREALLEAEKTSAQAAERFGSSLQEVTKAAKIEGQITDLIEEQVKLSTELNKINASNKELESVVQTNQVIVPELDTSKLEESAKTVKGDTAQTVAKEILAPVQSELDKQGLFSPELQTDLSNVSKGLFDIAVQEADAIEERLKSLQEQSQIFANVTGAALGGFSTKLAETFSTGNDIVDASIAALIKSGEQLLQELIKQSLQAQAIKTASATKDIAINQAVATSDAVRAGSSTAAASGPAAAFLLPALIGAAVGFIAASFAGIKFATGGIVPGGSFNGDQVPAMLNSGEMVLNSRQQSNLFSMLDGNIRGLRDRSDTGNFVANTVIRGSDLLLSIEREQRKR